MKPSGMSAIDPFQHEHEIVDERGLTAQVAGLLADPALLAEAERGNPAVVAFGRFVGDLRRGRGWGRLQLAQSAGINPRYLLLLETGMLGERAPSPTVVARLALAFERPLDSWPVLPWSQEQPPESQVEADAGRATLRPGLTLLSGLVAGLLERGAIGVEAAPQRGGAQLLVNAERLQLPVLTLAGPDYAWRLVAGQLTQLRDGGWVFDGYLRAQGSNAAVGGQRLRLLAGARAVGTAESDGHGYLRFESLGDELINQLELVVEPNVDR